MKTHHSQPIFIGGTGRSGTTILARVMGRHPDVHTLRWETQFLTHRRGLVNLHHRGYRWRDRIMLAIAMAGVWYRRTLRAGTPDAYEAGLCADVKRGLLIRALLRFQLRLLPGFGRTPSRLVACRKLVNEIFQPATEKAGAERWCEKTPSNLIHFPELQAMFPTARFLHIVRDPRDVVCSLMSRNFWPIASSWRVPGSEAFSGPVTFEGAVFYWKRLIEVAEENRQLVGDATCVLRLEDLVDSPRETISRVLEFLELRNDEQILAAMIENEKIDSGLMMPVQKQRANLERWRNELDDNQLSWLESELGELMQRHGYPLVTVDEKQG